MNTDEQIFDLPGAKIALRPNAVSELVMKTFALGLYEQIEATLVPTIVEPGDRIVELGGGIGYISAIAGKLGIAQSITVFEANPELIPIIKRNHELNGVKAEVRNQVVLPKVTAPTVPFYLRKEFWGSSMEGESSPYQRIVDVETTSFGHVLKELAPTMLIVDIEGGELALFDDIPLTGIKKIYVELHQKVIGRVGMKRVFDFFSSKDFHYDQHHSSGGVVLFSHVVR
jgi:FkbM family methyltransferase